MVYYRRVSLYYNVRSSMPPRAGPANAPKWRNIMIKVVKFGGSSLASAEQFEKAGSIIRADEARRYVVPSAPGKRNSGDTKVTDMLYECYELAENGQAFSKQLGQIKDRYNEIIRGLKLDLSLKDDFDTIKKQFTAKAGSMYAASRGEYLNGKIMAVKFGPRNADKQRSPANRPGITGHLRYCRIHIPL